MTRLEGWVPARAMLRGAGHLELSWPGPRLASTAIESEHFNWTEVLVGTAIGFVLSFAALVAVEILKRPRFRFSVEPPSIDPQQTLKFLSVRIENVRHPLLPILDKTAAYCRARIEFVNRTGTNQVIDLMEARWPTYQPEPQDTRDVFTRYRETLPPGESTAINIAVKFNGEQDCWGFNNLSYLPSTIGKFRHAKQRLPVQDALVCVLITFEGGTRRSPVFKLLNPTSSISDFALIAPDG